MVRRGTSRGCEDADRVASLGVTDHRAGAGGNYDWADLYCETAGYTFAFRHHRAVAWGTAMTRMTRKKQDSARQGRLLAPRARILWERPLGTQESPERPFPFIHGPPRASVDAKPDPAVLQFIRPIVVPTGPGAPMLSRCLDFAGLTQFRQVRSLHDQRPRRVGELDFLGRELAEDR